MNALGRPERTAGVDRVPVPVLGPDAVVVSSADLDRLEELLDALHNQVALLTPEGIHWDDPSEREEVFAEATDLWLRCGDFMRAHGWDWS